MGNLKYLEENKLNPNTRKLKFSEKIGSKMMANKTKYIDKKTPNKIVE
jgi:hypothetical protein